MQRTFTDRERYPHREAGLILFILSIMLFVLAVVLGGLCSPGTYNGPYAPGAGSCAYPYAGGAVALGLLGVILFVVGIVLMAWRDPATLPPVPYLPAPWAQYPPPPPAPPAPLHACRTCGRVYPMGLHAFCPACGTKLGA